VGRTFIRQDTQLKNSDVYDDTIAPNLANFETNPVNIEEDLNNIRSQLSNLLDVQAGNWYDTINTPSGGSQRGVNDLNTDLNTVERKKMLCRANVLTDITVTAAQNWEILSFAGSETPTEVKAIALTQDGAVVAQTATSGAGFDVHELDEIAGPDALNPKNLVVVRDAATGQVIQSSGRDVFGLLQTESTATDGTAFDDTSGGDRAKISFVRPNAGFSDLEACPVADIAGSTINYNYVRRIEFASMPEDCGLANTNFLDQSASVDVTRSNAYSNQGATAVEAATNATLDLNSAGIFWEIRDLANATLFRITEGSTGGTTEVALEADVDTFRVDAIVNDFDNGASFDTGAAGTTINVGVTPNQIDSGGALAVVSGGASDLDLVAAALLTFTDQFQSGSGYTSDLVLSDASAEWDAYEAAFGEVSILSAIVQANTSSTTRSKTVAALTSNVSADTNVTGAGMTPNIDAQLGDYSTVTFTTDVDVFVNGVLMRNGADAMANHDVYPGDTPANGDLKFEFALKSSPGNADQITMIIYS
jgi:hypothetical protein